MSDFLKTIVDAKKIEVANLYKNIGLETFQNKYPLAKKPSNKNSFYKALKKTGLSLIAEVKKASPSKGVIRKDFEPVQLAKDFEDMGAAAISVLTEKDFFLGSSEYLKNIKEQVRIPVLRKDFIIDPIQVYEAKDIGADAVLLIKAILDNQTCQMLLSLTNSLGLDVLLEIHNEEELEQIKKLENVSIVGINNRNLTTFEVDINTAPQLKAKGLRYFNSDVCFVAESGYQNQGELNGLCEEEFDGILIGEGLALNKGLFN